MSGHSDIKLSLVECCSDGWPAGTLPDLLTGHLELSPTDHWTLSHVSNQDPFLSDCSVLSDRAGQSPDCSKLFPFENVGGHCSWSSTVQQLFKTFPRRGTLAAALLTTWLSFYAPIGMRHDIDRHVSLSITSNQLNLMLEMHNQSLNTSQRWTRGMKAPQNQVGFHSQKP